MSKQLYTDGSLTRGLMALAMPMLVGALLQNMQTLIDLFWVGWLGASAVASVAVSGTVLMVLFPLLMGLSTGTVALVSRAIGAGRDEDAHRATAQSLMLAIILGAVSGGIGWFFSDAMMRLLGAEPDVVAGGGAYLRISLLGSFTVFILFIGSSALQGAGEAVVTMKVMLLSNILNIVLDPIFIFGSGVIPAMGVRGAALATVLAQAVAAAVIIVIMMKRRSRLHLRWSDCRPDPALAWRLMRIGIPGSGQMFSRSLVNAVMMKIVATCGTAAVAAYGIGMRLHMVVLMPAFALGGAAATMVGQNLGAGKPERAERSAWLATWIDAAFMAVAAAALAIFAPALIAFFNKDPQDGPAVISIGAHYLRVVSPFYVFAAFGIVLGRALNGAGDSMGPMVITIIGLWAVQVPLAIIFARLWQPATEGIWWAMSAAFVVNSGLVAVWFMTGRWKQIRV